MFEEYGLIQLGRDKPIIHKRGEVYVITHPFWGEYMHPYIDKLEALIRDSTSPILTLDWGFYWILAIGIIQYVNMEV